MHQKKIISAGKPIEEAHKVMIMIHGRGASAEDILSLSAYLPVDDFALMAPQATNNTWYPYSFLEKPNSNEPWLSSALALLKELVEDIRSRGIQTNDIYILGFSQGACLTLEFAARHAAAYGGIIAFTGGLIGDKIYAENYKGDFGGAPVFIGSSDPDPHVPVERVQTSANLLRDMNAAVTEQIYKNMGHTVSPEEINEVKKLIFSRS